jgi:lipopolysaccharide heptosyltransferase II
MTKLKQALKEVIRALFEALMRVYLAGLSSGEFSPARVKSILVFAYHGLGNFIMYTPAMKLLRERYPSARIDLQVGNDTGSDEVLEGAGLFENIYALPYDAGLRAWIRRVIEIRSAGYDMTLNEFHSHSWKLSVLVALGGVPFRVGHVTSPGWPERFSRYSFVFNVPVEMREDEHEVERYIDLVVAAGARRMAIEQARPFIHLNSADWDFADRFLAAGSLDAWGALIGVQPGTSTTMRWKQWPLERYRELVEQLLHAHPDSRIVLFGSPSERPMIEEVAEGLGPRILVAAGRTNVKQAAALIGRCTLLVSNDSGLMHVAVAMGTPVAAIYGPTDIRRTAPLGVDHTVIRHSLPCSPCFKLEGDDQVRLCPHHDCLMTITTDEVYVAITGKITRPAVRLHQVRAPSAAEEESVLR